MKHLQKSRARFVKWMLILVTMVLLGISSASAAETNIALDSATAAAKNLEKYRDEINALIKGTPSFADSQRQLGITVPGTNQPLEQPRPINKSTLMVFLTLSMPDDALAGWLDQTARAGGVAVIRGFHGNKMSATIKRLTVLQEHAPTTKMRGGVSIDPTAFSRFNVEIVPTVIVSDAPLLPCATNGCVGDPAPAHDRIAGNMTLNHALKLLAQNGQEATQAARKHLTELEER